MFKAIDWRVRASLWRLPEEVALLSASSSAGRHRMRLVRAALHTETSRR